MKHRSLVTLGVLLVAGLLAGCEQGMISQSAHENQIASVQAEKQRLIDQLRDRDNENNELRREVAGVQGELKTTKLEVDSWKTKYGAAKVLIDADKGVQGLPPELLEKFLEIARGPWEIAGGGARLKASSDILFDSGKITLKIGGEKALRDIALKLKDILTDKRVMLRIDGHTDNEGIKRSPWKDNMELSQERARAVWVYLVSQGVPAKTMGAMGYGEFHPIADNSTREGRTENRRVELSLISVVPTGTKPAGP